MKMKFSVIVLVLGGSIFAAMLWAGGLDRKVVIPIKLAEVKFNDGVNVDNDCDMQEALQSSLFKHAKKYSLNIDRLYDEPLQSQEKRLSIIYTDVQANKMSEVTLRPASVATVRVEIVENGKIISSTTKEADSKVSLRTCARLESIANAQGEFIAQWAMNTVH